MIQRSGSSARSRAPISAATARTRSTLVLSSVSGSVKNCGAWGSIAPPTTVDIMIVSPYRFETIPRAAERQAQPAIIAARGAAAGAGGFTGGEEGSNLAAFRPARSRRFPREHVARRHDGRGANYD